MNQIIEIKMGELETITNDTDTLKTFVGSCVAICIFDIKSKIASMAHVMLPRRINTRQSSQNDIGKYADEALSYMINDLIKKGADRRNIQAKMAGGATIFEHESETGLFSIGLRNTAALKQLLQECSIPLVSEDIGNNFGRWVIFNLNSGEMTITSSLKKMKKTI